MSSGIANDLNAIINELGAHLSAIRTALSGILNDSKEIAASSMDVISAVRETARWPINEPGKDDDLRTTCDFIRRTLDKGDGVAYLANSVSMHADGIFQCLGWLQELRGRITDNC